VLDSHCPPWLCRFVAHPPSPPIGLHARISSDWSLISQEFPVRFHVHFTWCFSPKQAPYFSPVPLFCTISANRMVLSYRAASPGESLTPHDLVTRLSRPQALLLAALLFAPPTFILHPVHSCFQLFPEFARSDLDASEKLSVLPLARHPKLITLLSFGGTIFARLVPEPQLFFLPNRDQRSSLDPLSPYLSPPQPNFSFLEAVRSDIAD